jgi:hypothetical protein
MKPHRGQSQSVLIREIYGLLKMSTALIEKQLFLFVKRFRQDGGYGMACAGVDSTSA